MSARRAILEYASWLMVLCPLQPRAATSAEVPGPAPVSFERDVRPILKSHCFHCHGEESAPKGGLDLRLVRTMTRGGDTGPAVIPGKLEESYLWDRVSGDEMPPGEKKLSAREKATIGGWIRAGAPTLRAEPARLAPGPVFSEEETSFWAFQTIRLPAVPVVRDGHRVRTPIDAFLLSRLEAKGLSFSADADRPTLIRRVTFDLTGLPPTPREIDDFLADRSPDAYERLVDRLLASPRYGERWARHWLDVAGYADSDGYTASDPVRKFSFKYRDYVVRAMNGDRPWDELIREQLAGDELGGGPYPNLAPGELDRLIATGFLRMVPDGTGDAEVDQTQARDDVLAETVKVVSSAFLGLTVGCAQCHAHRYDPISQTDYFRLRAVFEPALDAQHWRTPAGRLVSLWDEARRAKSAAVDAEFGRIAGERQARIDELVARVLERELAAAPEPLRAKLRQARGVAPAARSPEQVRLLKEFPRVLVDSGNVSLYDGGAHAKIIGDFAGRLAAADAKRPAEDYAHCLTEVPGQAPATRLLFRGDPRQPRQVVNPGELAVLAGTAGAADIAPDDPAVPTSGRRLAYARHLTSGRHPLVARVLVNRAWMHHFGRGIVGTPADFGTLGERPSHPELLDWLASTFVRDGWSWKRLHRLILTSTAYRQASRREPALEAADPENRLLGRMNVRRLEAEALRDAILAVSGSLWGKMYGPPVPVSVDRSGLAVVGVVPLDRHANPEEKAADIGPEVYRRTIYVQVRRSLPVGMLESFDAPSPMPNCDRRNSSNVPPQALLLMNNAFVVEQARAMAARLAREVGPDRAAQVGLAWRLTTGGTPEDRRLASALAFLDRQVADLAAGAAPGDDDPKARAMATLCQALIGSNTFLYID